MTTTGTKTNPTVKALAAQLRSDVGVTGPRSKLRIAGEPTTFTAPQLLAERHRYDGDARVMTALRGIDYAVSTGRVAGSTAIYLRNLTPWAWCTLVAEVAVDCAVVGQVPRYLNDQVAPRALAWFADWSARD